MSILHIPLHPELHQPAVARKAGRSWETCVNDLIRRDIAEETRPIPTTPTIQLTAEPGAAIIVDVPPTRVEGPIEPPPQVDPWKTTDEIMRDLGQPGFQAGVLIGASALLAGESAITAAST